MKTRVLLKPLLSISVHKINANTVYKYLTHTFSVTGSLLHQNPICLRHSVLFLFLCLVLTRSLIKNALLFDKVINVRQGLLQNHLICVFQDWQERYIHPNYTHIMKDHLIETVSNNSCYAKWVAPNKTNVLSVSRVASQAPAGLHKDIYSPSSSVSGSELSGSGVHYFHYCLWTLTIRSKLASEANH